MTHELPPLPYDVSALAPIISAETLEYHYGKHHRGYVHQLNQLIPGTPFENLPLERIVQSAPPGPIFNNAAQAWNHVFFWDCLKPGGETEPQPELSMALEKTFEHLEGLRQTWEDAAAKHFGSGYLWLVSEESGNLKVLTTHDAGNPMTRGLTPLLTLDLWEHSYYLDYRNDRAKFVERTFDLLNWEFASRNFLQAHGDRVQISA